MNRRLFSLKPRESTEILQNKRLRQVVSLVVDLSAVVGMVLLLNIVLNMNDAAKIIMCDECCNKYKECVEVHYGNINFDFNKTHQDIDIYTWMHNVSEEVE